jgi:hypothetical protein
VAVLLGLVTAENARLIAEFSQAVTHARKVVQTMRPGSGGG